MSGLFFSHNRRHLSHWLRPRWLCGIFAPLQTMNLETVNMTLRRVLFISIILTGLLAACDVTTPGPQPTTSPVVPGVSPLASPLLSSAASVVPFRLDRPIMAGDTEVRGTGPAGVPIFIADVTFMGEPLGNGTIGSDGTFVVKVKPLPDGHRIGLALGVLNGTKWKPEDFYLQEYYGPDALQAPQVGFFHDTVMVGQQ
jgi:hypothetical protein